MVSHLIKNAAPEFVARKICRSLSLQRNHASYMYYARIAQNDERCSRLVLRLWSQVHKEETLTLGKASMLAAYLERVVRGIYTNCTFRARRRPGQVATAVQVVSFPKDPSSTKQTECA